MMDKKIVDYKVVSRWIAPKDCFQKSASGFYLDINKDIKDGWQPLGGISIVRDKDEPYSLLLSQAMVKYGV